MESNVESFFSFVEENKRKIKNQHIPLTPI